MTVIGSVPGMTMSCGGLKDDTKRADLIAYLATLK
jgi:cytochrome c2